MAIARAARRGRATARPASSGPCRSCSSIRSSQSAMRKVSARPDVRATASHARIGSPNAAVPHTTSPGPPRHTTSGALRAASTSPSRRRWTRPSPLPRSIRRRPGLERDDVARARQIAQDHRARPAQQGRLREDGEPLDHVESRSRVRTAWSGEEERSGGSPRASPRGRRRCGPTRSRPPGRARSCPRAARSKPRTAPASPAPRSARPPCASGAARARRPTCRTPTAPGRSTARWPARTSCTRPSRSR